MIVLAVLVLAVIAAIIIHERNQHPQHTPTRLIKLTELQETFEAEKNRLRLEVLKIAGAQQNLPQYCLDRIRQEVWGNSCESYYRLKTDKPDGGVETKRVPSTLWDILRWCVLRNDAPTMEKARELETKNNLSMSGGGLPKKKIYHVYDTRRRVDKLFDTMYPNAPAEHKDAWTEKLDQMTMANYHELTSELSEYGAKLINRVPTWQID